MKISNLHSTSHDLAPLKKESQRKETKKKERHLTVSERKKERTI